MRVKSLKMGLKDQKLHGTGNGAIRTSGLSARPKVQLVWDEIQVAGDRELPRR